MTYLKGLLIIFFCMSAAYSNAQFYQVEATGLKVTTLPYEKLDSTAVFKHFLYAYKKVINVVCMQEDTITKIAYYTTDRNEWTAFVLDFTFYGIIQVESYNFDNKGQDEIVIKGYGGWFDKTGGTGCRWLRILNIDNGPVVLLSMYFECTEQYGLMPTESNYRLDIARKDIEFTDREIVIRKVRPAHQKFQRCKLTNVRPGRYRYVRGRLRRRLL